MNTWIAGKSFMKHYWLIEKLFIVILTQKNITDLDYRHKMRVFKKF